MMGRGFPRDLCDYSRAMTIALYVGAVIVGAVLFGRTAGAQEPFISYDFEMGGLEDFFLPVGDDFCGTPLPVGTGELDEGAMRLSTDDAFGIGNSEDVDVGLVIIDRKRQSALTETNAGPRQL